MEELLEDLVAHCIQALERGDDTEVDQLCDGHPALAPEIRRQLASLEDAGLLGPMSDAEAALEIPERVGPYRVLKPLGRGGMGSVFLAEQDQPVRRRVALKVIRLGMDSREVLARFERERQALAVMSHPHIATVFDAGLTDQGRPFIAMEYVPGVPITIYCERHQLATDARLRLVAQVCDAVQHAHHKGVIHRDLKPSNVLVTEQDGVPMTKVIDFGVAKATHPDHDAATLHTERGQILGTPEYMSPEQAGRVDVDARTDVYSLGVLLYELLSGALPFEPSRLRASPGELLRIIRDEEPPAPSSRVTRGASGTTSTTTTAVRPRGDVAKLSRRLRGELDWITMKALAKHRERRYATPHELAEDLRRHLRNEPVLAGPPSSWYRVQKFVRRYRVPVAAAGAVLLALVAGLVTSLAFYGEARASARRAETNFGDALAAVDQLLTRVGDQRLAKVPHMEHVRRGLLEDALAFYRGFLAARREDPTLGFETARASARVARILAGLGRHDESEAAYRDALRLLTGLGATREYRLELASVRIDRAQLLRRLDRVPEAEDDLRVALASFGALRAPDPGDLRCLVGEATAQNRLGTLLGRERPDEMRAALTRATELAARVAEATGRPEDCRRQALYRGDLGNALYVFGESKRAHVELTAARDELEALMELEPDDLDLQEALARTCQQLATLYGRLDTASGELLPAVDIALTIREQQVAQFPRLPRYRAAVAELLTLRAIGQFNNNQVGLALDTHRTLISRWKALVAEFGDVTEYRHRLAWALNRFGRVGLDLRRFGSERSTVESETALQQARELVEESRVDSPRDTEWRLLHYAVLGNLEELLFDTGRVDAADPLSQAALTLARDLARDFPELPEYQREVAGSSCARGKILHARGDHAGAEEHFRAGIAALERGLASGGQPSWRPFLATLFEGLSQTLAAAGRFEAAAEAVNAAVEALPDDWRNRKNAAATLMQCRNLVLTAARPAAERARLAADYAERAEANGLAVEAAQAVMHERVGGMAKFYISRAEAALQLARIQFACGRSEVACSSVQRAIDHAGAAWRGSARGFGADRLRAFGAEATRLLHEHREPAAAARIEARLQQAIDTGPKR